MVHGSTGDYVNKDYIYYIIMFYYIISMEVKINRTVYKTVYNPIKVNQDGSFVLHVTKERGAYTNELMGWVRCTMGPGCTVPFNMHIHSGVQVAFVDEENDFCGCGMVYGDPIHIRDEITLLKVIDRIDNETTLEKLEDR